ncbi:hypothetical protein VPH35_046525 [Triticum aestivum]
MYMALFSVSFIYYVAKFRYEESKTSCSFGSDNPCVFNCVASSLAAEYMASMALYIRWRWVRNLGAMPKLVACILVNSPAVVMIIVLVSFSWGQYTEDPGFSNCLSYVLAVALAVFLWWCVSIDRALSKNSSLPHVQEKSCKTDGVFEIWTCGC